MLVTAGWGTRAERLRKCDYRYMAAAKSEPTRILVLGGGYVGLYTAYGLQKMLRANEASVTVVDPQPHKT